MSINAWNNIKTEIPEVEKIGDENNADYVFLAIDNGTFTAIFLTEDEFNIVWKMSITSAKSYLKGYIEYNDDSTYDYYDKSRDYLNFDFVFLLNNQAVGEILVCDDIDVKTLRNIEKYNSGYIIIYVPYTQLNNNFLFKIDTNDSITRFTKEVSIDVQHPIEVNGVNYYPIISARIS